jgi:hypothetical protein
MAKAVRLGKEASWIGPILICDQAKAPLGALRPDVLSECPIRDEDFSESF